MGAVVMGWLDDLLSDPLFDKYEREREWNRLKGAWEGAKKQWNESGEPEVSEEPPPPPMPVRDPADAWLEKEKAERAALARTQSIPGFKSGMPEQEPKPKVNRFEAAMLPEASAAPTRVSPKLKAPAAMEAPPVSEPVEEPGVEIGDRNVSLIGEEAPGIGLEMTQDRHQTLKEEVPENTSDHPLAQVDNKRVAPAQNLFIGAVEAKDVARAAQKERAPKDRSAYYAALKQIADSSYRMIGQEAPSHDYYTAKMGQEQDAQKAWRGQMAEALKQKFADAELQKRLDSQKQIADANRLSAETRAKEGELGRNDRAKAARDAMDARAAAGREAAQVRAETMADALKDRTSDKDVRDFEKDAPGEDILNRADTIEEALKMGPVPGFGRVQNTLRGLPGFLGRAGDAAVQWGMSTDEQRRHQIVYDGTMQLIRDAGGKTLPPDEALREEKRLGEAAGQGEEVLHRVAAEIVANIKAKTRRKYNALSPQAKQKVIERGVISQDRLDTPEDDDEYLRPY